MKADGGCAWASEKPPGAYSTRTPFMLLLGTFGNTWSKTSVTFAPSPPPGVTCAKAEPDRSVGRTVATTSDVSMSIPFMSLDAAPPKCWPARVDHFLGWVAKH